MQTVFRILFVGLIAIAVAMVFFILHKKNLFDRLNALFSINTVIVLLIITVGFKNGHVHRHSNKLCDSGFRYYGYSGQIHGR